MTALVRWVPKYGVLLSHRKLGFFSVLAIVQLTSSRVGMTNVAGLCATVLFAFVASSSRHSIFAGLYRVFVTMIASFTLVYFLSEISVRTVERGLPNFIIQLTWVLSLWFCYQPSENEPFAKKKVALSVFAAVAGWIVTLCLTLEAKIRLLGYGYDNYGHLTGARRIAISNQSFYLGRSDLITLVVTDSPQSAAAFLGGVLDSFDESVSTVASVNLLFYLTFAMPIIIVISLLAVLLRGQYPLTSIFSLVGLVLILDGHLGRIWFSGYFSSNIATFLLCLFMIAFSSRSLSFWEVCLVVPVIVLLWPPLGILTGLLLGAAGFFFLVRIRISAPNDGIDSFSEIRPGSGRGRKFLIALTASSLTCIIFEYLAISRTFSSNHFLALGGLERLPKLHYGLLLFALLVALLSAQKSCHLGRNFGVFTSVGSIALLIFTAYRYGEVGYYPAKVLIGFTTALLLAVCYHASDVKRASGAISKISILCVCCVLIVYGTSDGGTFLSGYMGKMANVLESWTDERDEVVSAELVAYFVHNPTTDTVVILSDRYESELNTRWINSVSMNWTDSRWSDWAIVQQAVGVMGTAMWPKAEITVVLDESYGGIARSDIIEFLEKSGSIEDCSSATYEPFVFCA